MKLWLEKEWSKHASMGESGVVLDHVLYHLVPRVVMNCKLCILNVL